jgi:hypothetical protein
VGDGLRQRLLRLRCGLLQCCGLRLLRNGLIAIEGREPPDGLLLLQSEVELIDERKSKTFCKDPPLALKADVSQRLNLARLVRRGSNGLQRKQILLLLDLGIGTRPLSLRGWPGTGVH